MPGTAVENLATLWSRIKDKYTEFGTRDKYGSMRMSMFAAGGCAWSPGSVAAGCWLTRMPTVLRHQTLALLEESWQAGCWLARVLTA